MRITRMRALAATLAACGGAAAAWAALALAGTNAETDAVIHACRHPNGGWVRTVASEGACRPREQAFSWNVQGPKGEPGPEGPPGPKGDPGQGLTALGDLEGIACATDGGGQGKVTLDFAGDDTVLFRCVAGEEPPPEPTSTLVINEVDYDQVGADGQGFVEIANTGESPADLSGIALVFVDGADSAEYGREDLSGTLDPGGYHVVAVDPQNGAPDGLALLDTGAGALLDALSYEGAITDAVIDGTTFSLVEGAPLDPSVADSNTIQGSLSRIPDRADTNDAASDWAFTESPTPGAENVLTPPS
jgi:Lamin Tail Domain